MKCPKCGNEVEKNENFCNNCGTKLNTQTSKFSISLKKIIILVAVILVIIFVASIGVYLSNNSKPVAEPPSIEEQQVETYTPNQAGIFRNEANVIEEKFDKNNNITYYKTKNANGTFNEETFTYQYDDQNRLTRMANNKDEYITITYNENGQISSTTNSSGLVTNYFYNDNKELSYKIEKLDTFETIHCYKTYKDNDNEYVLEHTFDNSFTKGGFIDRGYKIYRKSDLNTPDFSNAFQFMQLAIIFDTNYFLGYDNLYSINYNIFPYSEIMGYKTTLKSFSVSYNIFNNLSVETSKTEKYFDKEHRILKEEKTDDEPEYYKYKNINDNEILQEHLFESADIDTDEPVYLEYKIKYYFENNNLVKKEYISTNESLTKTEYEELKKEYIKYFNENVDITDYGDIEGYSNEILSYDRILDLYVDNKKNETNDNNIIENNDTSNSNSSQQTPIYSSNSNQINSSSNTPTYNDTSTTTPQPNTSTNQQPNNNNTNVDIPSTPVINEIGHNLNTNLSTGEKTANIYIYARDEKDDNLTVTVNGEKVNYSVNSCVYKTNTLNTGTNTFNIVITNKYGKSITKTYTIEI